MSRAMVAVALLVAGRSRGAPGGDMSPESSDAALRDAARHDIAGDWRFTGRDAENTRWSPLTQIDTANVARLAVAWTYHTGDAPPARSEIQATPIVIGGVLYTTT